MWDYSQSKLEIMDIFTLSGMDLQYYQPREALAIHPVLLILLRLQNCKMVASFHREDFFFFMLHSHFTQTHDIGQELSIETDVNLINL